MSNVIEELRDKGISYNVMADASGVPYPVIRNARKDISVLPAAPEEKLKRLDAALDTVIAAGEARFDPVALYEEQIIVAGEGDNACWTHLRTLWENGVISDDELARELAAAERFYSYAELQEDYPLEHEIVDASDGHKAIVARISLRKASPADFLAFRKALAG